MLKNLIDAINVSSLSNPNKAYELIKSLYPDVNKENILGLFTKPLLLNFDLTIGTNKSKIDSLRKELKRNSLSAYILSTNDEFINEYTPLYAKRLYYLTGFSGSYGFAIITLNSAAIFVDGRYTEQATKQVDSSIFKILPLSYNDIINYCANNLLKNSYIALNSRTNSFKFCSLLLNTLNLNLKFLEYDLVDNIWHNQPPLPVAPISIYPPEYSGENTLTKVNKVINYLNNNNLDALLVTALDNIAWLLNIRGNDIEYSPFILSTLIVYKNGTVDFFVDKNKIVTNSIKYFKENNINCFNYEELDNKLNTLKNINIGIYNNSPYFYFLTLKKISNIKLLDCDYISNLKSIKNRVESSNSYIAHYKDGAAFTKLIIWLNNAVNNNTYLTETDIINQINHFKSATTNYQGNSFASIVASNSNAAFPHYQTTEESNKQININTILLIDCGSQYLEGTTDVTRTITFSNPSTEFKKHFTLVLKGLIALSSIKFPKNTPCCNLDVLARQYLWKYGLDYAHGTGHGVGHYLSVHEGPVSINQRCTTLLKEDMVLSIEPGYYKLNHYGIRIENLVITKESKDNSDFLEFSTLTNVPIDKKNIDFSMLTNDEYLWLQQYSDNIVKNLSKFLNKEEITLLEKLLLK